MRAAHAAQCAADQNRYWEMHDRLFADADQFSASHDQDFSLFRGMAGDLGLNVGQYMDCMESRKYLDRIGADLSAAQAAGVRGTPAYALNGEMLFGLYPTPVWENLIDAHLKALP